MKSDSVPFVIGTASIDVTTMAAAAICVTVVLAVMIGIRKDLAAFALVAGGLAIALTM